MLLLGVLAALLAAGLWMYALIDILLTPAMDCCRLRKGAWLAIAGLLFVPGAVAWLVFGRPYTAAGRYLPGRAPRPGRYWPRPDLIGPDAEAALRRHPAGRARQDLADLPYYGDAVFEDAADLPEPAAWPTGPDDDPDFLSYLDQVVREIREAGNGA
jgi:hypothetical protein